MSNVPLNGEWRMNSQGLLCTSSDKVDASLLEAAGSNIVFSFTKAAKYHSFVASATNKKNPTHSLLKDATEEKDTTN